MPSSVDGDIKLKVGLDGTEAKKDAMNLGKSIQQSLSKLNAKNASSSMLGLRNQINKVTADLEKAKAKKEELAKTTIYSDDYKRAEKDYVRYGQQLDSLREKERQLVDEMNKMGMTQTVSNPAYTRLSKELDSLNDKYGKLFDKREQFEAVRRTMGESSEKIQSSTQYRKMTAELELLDKQAEQTEQILAKLDKEIQVPSNSTAKYQSLQQELNKVKTAMDEVAGKRIKAQTIMADPTHQTPGINTQAYEDANNKVKGLEGRLEQLAARYREVGDAGHKSGSKQGLGARIAQKAWSGFKGGFKNVIKSFKCFGKEANSTFEDVAKNAKSMFWKILKYGLSIRSLYTLIRKLRNTFKESIQVMGMDIPRIRDELNSLINGFTQVKYSLATAFQPIMSYIVPALNTLISALNSAMIALANFFATFTGQKVIYKATKQNKDYAKSISGAGKAAEDANEDIAEYDKLIVINQDKDHGGGGGGGGDNGLDSGIFEEAPAQINKFAQLIKEAWKKNDFTDVGAYIGKKLNEGLESIKWDKIKQTASNIGKDFATLINGIVNVPGLGSNIGRTLAEAFNTAWTTVNTFVHTLDWAGVGEFIGNSIVSFLTTLDLSMLGENIALGLNGIATTVLQVFSTINQDLPQILDNINKGIDTFLDTFDPVIIGKAFGEVSKAILGFVQGVLPKIPKIASKLGQLFDSMVKNFPSEEFAKTVSGLLRSAIQGVTNFISEVDFAELGKKIGQFLANLDIMGVVGDIAQLIWEVIKAAFKMIPSLIQEAPLESALIGAFALLHFTGVGSSIAGKIGSSIAGKLLSNVTVGPLGAAFTKLFGAAGPLALAVAAAIGGWALGDWLYDILPKDKAGDNFIDNTVDWILGGDPRKVMQEATAGLDMKSLIYEQLQNPYYQARQEVAQLGLTGKEAYEYLAKELDKVDVEGFIEANKTGAVEVDEAARDTIEAWKEEQLEAAKAKYGVEEVKKSYAGIPTEAQNAMQQANKNVSESIDDLNTQAQEVTKTYNGMPSDVQAKIEESNNVLSTSFKSVKDQVEEVKGAYTVDDYKAKIDEVNAKLAESFGTTKDKIEEVKGSYAGMPSDVREKVEQSNGEWAKSFATLKDDISKVKNAVTDYKKATTQTSSATKKATEKSANSFKNLQEQVISIKEKTDDYNEKLKATNDTISKTLDTTNTKAQNIGTSTTRSFSKIKNNITNIASEVYSKWKTGVEGAVTEANKTLTDGITNLGTDSILNLAKAFTDDTTVLTNASNLGSGIYSAITTPFTGENSVANVMKNQLSEVATDTSGTSLLGTFQSLGSKLRNVFENLFKKKDITDGYEQAIKHITDKESSEKGLKKIATSIRDFWKTKFGNIKSNTINAYSESVQYLRKSELQSATMTSLKGIIKSVQEFWAGKMSKIKKSTTDAYDSAVQHLAKSEGNGTGGLSKVGSQIAGSLQNAFQSITGTGKNDSLGNQIVDNLTGAWKVIVDYINGGKSLTDASDKINNSYSNTADNIKNKFTDAFNAIKNAFGYTKLEVQISDNLQISLIGTLQNMAQNINGAFNKFVNSFNDIVDKMNNGGSFWKKVSGALYRLAHADYQIPVPGLAQGGVIPPNKEFLAVLGDQKQGTNIETPLQTMIDAFNTALDRRGNNSSNSAPIVLQLNGREIARAVWDEDMKKYKQTGKYSPNYS